MVFKQLDTGRAQLGLLSVFPKQNHSVDQLLISLVVINYICTQYVIYLLFTVITFTYYCIAELFSYLVSVINLAAYLLLPTYTL